MIRFRVRVKLGSGLELRTIKAGLEFRVRVQFPLSIQWRCVGRNLSHFSIHTFSLTAYFIIIFTNPLISITYITGRN